MDPANYNQINQAYEIDVKSEVMIRKNEDSDEEMSVDEAIQHAKIMLDAANALGKLSIEKAGGSNDIADG
ncbi:hypothetical protein Tco_0599670 [Tanacetum coccineum]